MNECYFTNFDFDGLTERVVEAYIGPFEMGKAVGLRSLSDGVSKRSA